MTDKASWHQYGNENKTQVNSIEVLSCIYTNAEASLMTVKNVLTHVNNDKLKQILDQQAIAYEGYINRAKKLAEQYNIELLGSNNIAKAVGIVSVKIHLITGCSTSNIAELLIVCTTQRVIDLGKTLRHTPGVSDEVTSLAGELIIYEQEKIESMKYYL